MSSTSLPWIWQQAGWPNLTFSYETVAADERDRAQDVPVAQHHFGVAARPSEGAPK